MGTAVVAASGSGNPGGAPSGSVVTPNASPSSRRRSPARAVSRSVAVLSSGPALESEAGMTANPNRDATSSALQATTSSIGLSRRPHTRVATSRRRAGRHRRAAERAPFAPPPLARQGRVTIGGGSLIGPSARERGGNDGESQQRRHEQRTPGHDQQHRSLAQAPHEGRDRGRDAYGRDHRRGGET